MCNNSGFAFPLVLAPYNKWDLNTFNVVRVCFCVVFVPTQKNIVPIGGTTFSIWVRYTTSPTSHFWEDSHKLCTQKLRWGHSWKFFGRFYSEKNSQIWNGRCRCVVFWSESGSILTLSALSFGHTVVVDHGNSKVFVFLLLLIWMDFWDTPKFNEQIIEPFVSFWLPCFGWRAPQHNH